MKRIKDAITLAWMNNEISYAQYVDLTNLLWDWQDREHV